jgi:hypothetical protein
MTWQVEIVMVPLRTLIKLSVVVVWSLMKETFTRQIVLNPSFINVTNLVESSQDVLLWKLSAGTTTYFLATTW